VIVRNIWRKLSSVERKVTLIVTNFWQLFSEIFGETRLAPFLSKSFALEPYQIEHSRHRRPTNFVVHAYG
jgi:hypothetical protein